MKRALIIGCPGTGKTTFSKKLAAISGLPLIHLDMYYHDKTKDYYNEINKEAWYAQIDKLINEEEWIIDGNYNSTLDSRVERADTIIFFDLPRYKALIGVLRRRIELHGKKRDDMPSDWIEHIDWGFIRYVWDYKKAKRPKIKKTIETPQNKKLIVFHDHKQAEEYLATLSKK